MEERFLLDGITLESTHVSPRHKELSALVVADMADSGPSFRDGTTMTASRAAKLVSIEFFAKVPLANILIEDCFQGRHELAPGRVQLRTVLNRTPCTDRPLQRGIKSSVDTTLAQLESVSDRRISSGRKLGDT